MLIIHCITVILIVLLLLLTFCSFYKIIAVRFIELRGVFMKKLSFLLAMFVLMLVFGLAFVSCNNDLTDGGSGNVNIVVRAI